MNELMHVCRHCHAKTPFELLLYDESAEALVCKSCVGKGRAKKVETMKDTRTKMMCSNCNYRFYLNPKVSPRCPNCGESCIEEAMSAQQILNQVVDRDKD